jgi:putative ABC transport system substrate-binding protein
VVSGLQVRRREFVFLLGGLTAWPRVTLAQQPLPVIGFLGSASPASWAHFVDAFRAGLKETGFIEGRNVAIEFRWAEGQYDRLREMASELAGRKVAVLVSTGGMPSVLAAKEATSTIPIVFTLGVDPVRFGLVASLNRPGGNLTGVNMFTAFIDTKRLGILHDMVPKAALIAVLINPKNPNVGGRTTDIETAARAMGLQLQFLHASTRPELDAAFRAVSRSGAGALFVGSDPFFNAQRDYIVAQTAHHGIAAMYGQREFAIAGGLMSYGTDSNDSYRQAGIYVGRILKGEKPAELPVVQSTKFEFVINLTTAKSLGLTVPASLSAMADEIIE